MLKRYLLGNRETVAGTVYGTIVVLAVLAVVILAVGAAGVLSADAAIWAAFGAGVVTLGAQGVRYARLEKLSLPASIVSVTLNLALGLALVAAEVVVSH